MKKIVTITLAALTSTVILPAAAGGLGNGLALTLTGALHQSSQNGDDFIPVSLPPLPAIHIGTFFHDHHYDLNGGFELSYRFSRSKTWLVVNWDYYNYDDLQTAVEQTAIPASPGLPLPVGGPLTPGVDTAFSGNLEYKEKVFNVGLRQLSSCCGNQLDLVWGAYLQWAQLKRDKELSFVDPALPNITDLLRTKEEAQGVGPYVDVTARAYPWGPTGRCFSVYGHTGVALLYMDHNYQFSHQQNYVDQSLAKADESSSIISKIVADFGGSYNRVFRGKHDWRLGMQLGLNYINYINVFKQGNRPGDRVRDKGRWGPAFSITIGGVDS